MEVIYKRVGENVRAVRKQANITQAKMAEVLNVSPSHYSSMECGKKKFSVAQLVTIARYLRVQMSSLTAGLVDEDAYPEIISDDIEYFPVTQTLQNIGILMRKCSRKQIDAMRDMCEIIAKLTTE